MPPQKLKKKYSNWSHLLSKLLTKVKKFFEGCEPSQARLVLSIMFLYYYDRQVDMRRILRGMYVPPQKLKNFENFILILEPFWSNFLTRTI